MASDVNKFSSSSTTQHQLLSFLRIFFFKSSVLSCAVDLSVRVKLGCQLGKIQITMEISLWVCL